MIVALYARVSTTRQAEKDLSIPDQLRQMKEWSKARHYQVAADYVEPGASATDDRRPIFQQMIADACTQGQGAGLAIMHQHLRLFSFMPFSVLAWSSPFPSLPLSLFWILDYGDMRVI